MLISGRVAKLRKKIPPNLWPNDPWTPQVTAPAPWQDTPRLPWAQRWDRAFSQANVNRWLYFPTFQDQQRMHIIHQGDQTPLHSTRKMGNALQGQVRCLHSHKIPASEYADSSKPSSRERRWSSRCSPGSTAGQFQVFELPSLGWNYPGILPTQPNLAWRYSQVLICMNPHPSKYYYRYWTHI